MPYDANMWQLITRSVPKYHQNQWWFIKMASIKLSHHIHYKVWDEITYPFLNFNGATVEV